MASFGAVSWAYKALITSAKLQQMVDNIVAHDHREDGTQGAPLVEAWKTPTGVAAGAGFTLTRFRYRVLLGGRIVAYDAVVTRTGGQLAFTGTSGQNPGNVADVDLLTGIPTAARPAQLQLIAGGIAGQTLAVIRVETSGKAVLASGVPAGTLETGETVVFGGTLWLG